MKIITGGLGKLPRTGHKETRTLIHGKYVMIDDKIRDIVIILNELGYKTKFACEELRPNVAIIHFDESIKMKHIRKLQISMREKLKNKKLNRLNYVAPTFDLWLRVLPFDPIWQMSMNVGMINKYTKVLIEIYEDIKGEKYIK